MIFININVDINLINSLVIKGWYPECRCRPYLAYPSIYFALQQTSIFVKSTKHTFTQITQTLAVWIFDFLSFSILL